MTLQNFQHPASASDLQKVMKSARFEKGGRGANSQLFTGILCFKTNFTYLLCTTMSNIKDMLSNGVASKAKAL